MANDFLPTIFDGGAVWKDLSLDQQAEIGKAAVEYVLACHVMDFSAHSDALVWARAGEASVDAAQQELEDCIDRVFPGSMLDGRAEPLVPSIVGMFCRRCGCSQYDACDGGCDWAEPYLCTACAGPATDAASGAVAS